MWTKLLTSLWGGTKALAAGKAQANLGLQSPHLPAAIVRVGRFAYTTSGLWILTCWYSAYANMRTEPGSGPSLVLPGAPVIGPPSRPDKTPKFSTKTPGGGGGGSSNNPSPGATGGPVRTQVARIAASCVGQARFRYSQTRPMPRSINANPCPTDCSGFVTLVYKQAGAPDPNGMNYNGSGYTGTLLQHGTPTNNPQVGDLAFWKNPDHVAVVTGSGPDPAMIEFGGPPFPIRGTIKRENAFHSSFIGYRSYL